MLKKGFAGIALILVVGIVVVILGLVFYSTMTSEKSSTQTDLQNTNTETSSKESDKSSNSGLKFSKVSKDKLLFTGGYADPTVVQLDAGVIVMYVNKFGSSGSSYKAYVSNDGLVWTEKTDVTLPQAATGRGVKFDSKIRFYYPGLMPIKPSDPPASIFSSISSDGYNFSKELGERVAPKDGYYLEGPTVIKLSDEKYRMYFNENETDSKEKRYGKIYGATSTDGLTWVRDTMPTIESDSKIEKAPADWPQALHPFVLERPDGGYLMLYNTHSKVYAATSDDGINWTKVGYVGIEGADADGYFLPDGSLRVYYGNFTPETSGVVYTVDLKIE